jgi:hypothetical protein
MAMLLSYYDVYWNDNFVANGYEQDATYDSTSNAFKSSTLKTENSILENMHKEYEKGGGTLDIIPYLQPLYLDFVTTHQKKDFLHLDLIGMGIDAGYYDGIFQIDEYSTNFNQTAHLLDIYFDNIFGEYIYFDPLNSNSVLGENPPIDIKILDTATIGVSHNDVVDKMHELVNDGIPVMYRGSNGNSGHAMIAFSTEKDSNGNIVDCNLHTGWTDRYHDTLSSTEYNSDIAILWLEIDESQIPHVCCDNFVVGDEKSCSCRVYGDLHPKHIHEAGNTYFSMGVEVHNVKCAWDNAALVELHHFADYIQTSNTTHTGFCDCGYVVQNLPHQFTEFTNQSNLYHKAYCVCGYSKNEMHVTESINSRYSKCTICGAVFDMWSTPTIKGVNDPPPESEQ